jgi:uncharacterized protein DUF222
MTDTPLLSPGELTEDAGDVRADGSDGDGVSGSMPPVPGGVWDLDVRGVLDLVVGQRRVADAGEASLLAGVVALVGLDPVTDPEDAAYHPSNESPEQAVFAGLSTRIPLAGAGTPAASQDTVAALGAALGLSYRSAAGLVGEALELCFRLPRLWALVQAGVLQAWKARRVARATCWLSVAAVGFVDRHLAVTATRNQVPANLSPLITRALNRCDPDLAEGREEAALASRGVSFDYSTSTDSGATADLTARLDLLDALDLDHQITAMATTMGRLGDTDPLPVRRAHALGMLADPQHTLRFFGDLTDTTLDTQSDTDGDTGPAAAGRPACDRVGRAGRAGRAGGPRWDRWPT